MKKLIALLLLGCLGPACIDTDESVTLYLKPDDKLDFVAFLDDIRSDDQSEMVRQKEEKDFLRDFRSGKFLKPALVKAGGKRIKLDLIRSTVPYAAVVTGAYDSLENFWKVFEYGRGKTAQLSKDGDQRTLTFLFPSSAGEKPPSAKSRNDFPRNLKLVLTHGKFTAAKGFTLAADGKSCVLDENGYLALRAKPEPFALSVSWQKK